VEDVRVLPGAYNVVPSEVTIHLNMRHHLDRTLGVTIERLLEKGRQVALRRKLRFDVQPRLEQKAVPMNQGLVTIAERALRQAHCPSARMVSGLGHDAMIIAEKVPAVMIFVRTRDGLSEHPGSVIHTSDVDAAINAGLHFLSEVTAFQKAGKAAYA
jgi:allantoate deiminase